MNTLDHTPHRHWQKRTVHPHDLSSLGDHSTRTNVPSPQGEAENGMCRLCGNAMHVNCSLGISSGSSPIAYFDGDWVYFPFLFHTDFFSLFPVTSVVVRI